MICRRVIVMPGGTMADVAAAIAGWVAAVALGVWLSALRRRQSALIAGIAGLRRDNAVLAGHNDRLTERLRAVSGRIDIALDASPGDPSATIDAVSNPAVTIFRQPILNRGERHVLAACDALAAAHASARLRVFAQVSLGEILIVSSADAITRERAFRAFNARRSDIVIVDADGLAIACVEYQGDGHYQDEAATGDAIKRKVCDRAGIAFVAIPAAATTDEILAALVTAVAPLNLPGARY